MAPCQTASVMNAAVAPASKSVVFRDPLGERRHIADPSGADTLELLCLRNELTAVPSFEFALRERVARLANFRHAYYARVRSVDRLSDGSTLALVSDRVPGVRLSEILEIAERRQLTVDINTALILIRQLVPAVALLHEHARDVANGALGPERLVVTPNARLIIVEHVLGAALEQLRFSPDRYWDELRIPVPRSTGLPRFDHRADVLQLGVVALSLILGRPLHRDEYPTQIGEVVASAWAISARGGLEPLPSGLRAWLTRALQLDPRYSFPSAVEARAELDRMFGDSEYIVAPQALETFLAQYQDVLLLARPSPSPVKPEEPTVVAAARPAAPPVEIPKVADEPAAEAARITPVQPPPAAILSPRDEIEEDQEDIDMADDATPRRWPRWAAFAAILVALVTGGALAGRRYLVTSASTAPTGTLAVNTAPAGAQVFVDGQPQGVTPVSLTLKAGPHVVELRGETGSRSIPVMIGTGTQASQYVELPKVSVITGQLQVRTEPGNAQVTVDGVPRGRSPLTIGDLTPGAHTVLLENELGSVKQDVAIEAGTTASLVVPLTAPPGVPVSGWLAVTAPVTMQLYENGRLLGSSESERIMVSAGRHEIEISNQPLQYRELRTIQVVPGKVAPLKIELPNQKMSLNAVPWAEVWIDGQKMGETPIGDLPIPVGPHEIIFRHPELGEQRHAITVTASAPARLSVDMRKR